MAEVDLEAGDQQVVGDTLAARSPSYLQLVARIT
jgi:hypothetical protein